MSGTPNPFNYNPLYRFYRTGLMAAVVTATCVALNAHAQDKMEPVESQFELPDQEVERLQKESEALKEDKDGADDPTKAITPSDIREQPSGLKDSERLPAVQQDKLPAVQKDKLPAVQKQQPVSGEPEFVRVAPASGAPGSPIRVEGRHFGPDRGDRGLYFIIGGRGYDMPIRDWHDNRIMTVVPGHVDPGSAEIRMVSRDPDTILTAIDFEVISAIADSDALPDDAGRPDTGGPTGGGFAPDGGGFVGACDGPDPAAEINIENIRPNGDGSYNFDVVATISNVGRSDFNSGPGQQSAHLLQGSRTLESTSWTTLFAGTPGGSTRHTVTDWDPGSEFVSGYSVRIDYDPDIFVDDNPDNDDCNMRNNEAQLTADDIARELGS